MTTRYNLKFRVHPQKIFAATSTLKCAVPTLKNAERIVLASECTLPAEMLGAFTEALSPYLIGSVTVTPEKEVSPGVWNSTPTYETKAPEAPKAKPNIEAALNDVFQIFEGAGWPFSTQSHKTTTKTSTTYATDATGKVTKTETTTDANGNVETKTASVTGAGAAKAAKAAKTDSSTEKTDKAGFAKAEDELRAAEKRLDAAFDNFTDRFNQNVDRKTASMLRAFAELLEKI